jgi:2-polyprenyl-3-methyl-5-hydroxy-6-metoxy-1,4-benzoquinol methylase
MNVFQKTHTINYIQVIPCPVCESDSSLWVRLPTATLFRCTKCEHCFTDTSSIVNQETYGSDYYQKTHQNWFENPNYPLYARLASEISAHKSNTVLDIGCGNGAFLKYLRTVSAGLDLQGIDLSNEARSVSAIEFLQGDFLNYDFQKKFDAIVTLAVIEHVSDVSLFVRRIHELLNKNGIACVMTLNESGLLYRFSNFLRKIGIPSVFIRLYDPHHINHFSKESLERLLIKDGLFKVTKTIDHNTLLVSIDVPASNSFVKWVMKLGVVAIFLIGKMTKKSYLQTVVVVKVG